MAAALQGAKARNSCYVFEGVVGPEIVDCVKLVVQTWSQEALTKLDLD